MRKDVLDFIRDMHRDMINGLYTQPFMLMATFKGRDPFS